MTAWDEFEYNSATISAFKMGPEMGSEEFLKPKLHGERFLDHEIPLEFLEDFTALQELVIEVAKWRFLKENPNRERAPRGFSDGISLTLSGVEPGSAIPVIKLVFSAGLLFADGKSQHFFEARDAIVSAIAAAEEGKPTSEFIPDKALSYFDRFGRSLRDGESIEFTNQCRVARLTKEVRRKLVLSAADVEELTDETTIYGVIPAANQKKMTVEVELLDGRTIVAPFARQHHDAVIDAFKSFREGVQVRIKGVGRFSRNSRLKSLDSVEEISVIDPLDVGLRIEQLKGLSDGWLEKESKCPSSEGLTWFTVAFYEYFPDSLPLPYVYPTPQGGIQLEWTFGPHEVTLEIDLETHHAHWHAWDSSRDRETARELDLKIAEGWAYIEKNVGELAGTSNAK